MLSVYIPDGDCVGADGRGGPRGGGAMCVVPLMCKWKCVCCEGGYLDRLPVWSLCALGGEVFLDDETSTR